VLEHDDQFALIIADPPWVPSSDIGQFPEDPGIAIDGGDDGLDLARACIRVIGGHLMVGGAAVLQLGNLDQAEALTDLAKSCGLVFAHPRTFERGVLVRLDRG
jgi:release factor glutamine methyltransferase